jgi:tyrosinase
MPDNDNTSTPPSRYQRVKQILDAAAGNSTADYQGYGRFWNLPLPQLLEVTIYGVRMIAPPTSPDPCEALAANLPIVAASAPAKSGSCCHGTPAAAPAASAAPAPPTPPAKPHRYPGRGAKSGLIIGLRGQWPFDGTRFPPLPWGGTPVAPGDIQFISDWIDDGCPETDGAPADAAKVLALSTGAQAHVAVSDNTNAFKDRTGGIKQRQNVEHLTPQELCELRYAFGELQKLNQWPRDMRNTNSWAQLHGDECPHGWSIFLPWHRMYLWEFEQALQSVVPTVMLPYWDWTASTPEQIKAGYIPDAYRCWIDDAVLGALSGKVSAETLQKLAAAQGVKYTSITKLWQAAPGIPAADQQTIIAVLKTANPLFYELRFPGEFYDTTLEQGFHHHYPTPQDIQKILALDNWRDFGGGLDVDQSFGALDMNPHNTMHIWIGGNPAANVTGDMLSNLTAAFDPIFWAHHGNIDRLWAVWQALHPGVDPPDLNDVLQGVNATVNDSLSIRKLDYEYAADTYVFPTSNSLQLTRFRSADAGVKAPVLANHSRAEVRVHCIQQPLESFLVRVFLNQPDADVNTSIDNNPHYAGYFSIFGHGPCIGGPGHCDPPPKTNRRFERRIPHHNDPWNVRLDVTDTVRKLVAQGATDLQVNLVVLSGITRTGPGKLRMEAVSLTFHD